MLQKTPYVFPIVGGRKVEHLLANIEALSVVLAPEHIKQIEDAVPFDVGFPISMIVSTQHVWLIVGSRSQWLVRATDSITR